MVFSQVARRYNLVLSLQTSTLSVGIPATVRLLAHVHNQLIGPLGGGSFLLQSEDPSESGSREADPPTGDEVTRAPAVLRVP